MPHTQALSGFRETLRGLRGRFPFSGLNRRVLKTLPTREATFLHQMMQAAPNLAALRAHLGQYPARQRVQVFGGNLIEASVAFHLALKRLDFLLIFFNFNATLSHFC